MRLIIFFLACALVACGNPDRGKMSKNLGVAQSITVASTSDLTLGPCRNMTVFDGTDPAFATNFVGASACPGVNHADTVRLRMKAGFPTNLRLCLVPLSNTMVYEQASCFTINGQADIRLSTSAFTRVVLVRESELNAYYNYVHHPESNNWPPMGYAQLR